MILKLKPEYVDSFKSYLELIDCVFQVEKNNFNITVTNEDHAFHIGRVYQKMIYDLKQQNGKEKLLPESKGEISEG